MDRRIEARRAAIQYKRLFDKITAQEDDILTDPLPHIHRMTLEIRRLRGALELTRAALNPKLNYKISDRPDKPVAEEYVDMRVDLMNRHSEALKIINKTMRENPNNAST